jgi:hypothetical protein
MAEHEASQLGRKAPTMTILSDHPSESVATDLLGLESQLSAVLDILRHQKTQCPVTVAIYGDWGTGKTSAMHWLASQLKTWNELDQLQRENHPRVFSVWFYPWKYHDSRELGLGFIQALAAAELSVPPVPGVPDGGGADSTPQAPGPVGLNQFEEILKTWIATHLELDARMALFIDGLDHCPAAITLEVLEAIKHCQNLPKIIFVVGLDRGVVDQIVTKHYTAIGLGREMAEKHLGEIFQVEIQIAPSQTQMAGFQNQQIRQLDGSTGGYWGQALNPANREILEEGISELARGNPRELKRLLNSALLRGRAAADNPVLRQKTGSPLLFAQGVQFFLIQKIVEKWFGRNSKLLLKTPVLEWFQDWSGFVRTHPEYRLRESEPGKETGFQSEPDIRFKPILDANLRQDDGRIVDKQLLFHEALLWELLRIPFSAEVAQSAPNQELSKSAPAPVDPPAAAGDSARPFLPLPGLSDLVRGRIAQALNKSVDQLAAADLTTVRKLDFSFSEIVDEDLAWMKKLTALESLDLNGTRITGAGLLLLAGIPTLHSLNLGQSQISETGMQSLEKLTSLRSLNLAKSKVNDLGLVPLLKLTSLQSLNLAKTRITDIGVQTLEKLISLQSLNLVKSKVTETGFKKLQKTLPSANIIYETAPVPPLLTTDKPSA